MTIEGPVIAVPPIDGRTARRHRTRDAIVDAVSSLIDEGDLTPTRARIAARAGVSLRSINLHFDDREALLSAVAERHLERILGRVTPVDRSGPLPSRLDAFLAQRAEVLEALTNVSRASQVYEASSAALRTRRQAMLDLGRAEVRTVFGPELRRGGRLDEELLAAVDVACGWSTWAWLRSAGHAPEGACAVIRRTLGALLGEATTA